MNIWHKFTITWWLGACVGIGACSTPTSSAPPLTEEQFHNALSALWAAGDSIPLGTAQLAQYFPAPPEGFVAKSPQSQMYEGAGGTYTECELVYWQQSDTYLSVTLADYIADTAALGYMFDRWQDSLPPEAPLIACAQRQQKAYTGTSVWQGIIDTHLVCVIQTNHPEAAQVQHYVLEALIEALGAPE